MTDFRDLLRSKATETLAGSAYNELRGRRAGAADDGDPALFYEVLVPLAGTWEAFRDRAFPPFARWLRAQDQDPESPRGVVVAAFLGEHCLLLDGRRFLDVLREMDALNASALHFRVLQWIRE